MTTSPVTLAILLSTELYTKYIPTLGPLHLLTFFLDYCSPGYYKAYSLTSLNVTVLLKHPQPLNSGCSLPHLPLCASPATLPSTALLFSSVVDLSSSECAVQIQKFPETRQNYSQNNTGIWFTLFSVDIWTDGIKKMWSRTAGAFVWLQSVASSIWEVIRSLSATHSRTSLRKLQIINFIKSVPL
jgi:hypothetical protein